MLYSKFDLPRAMIVSRLGDCELGAVIANLFLNVVGDLTGTKLQI